MEKGTLYYYYETINTDPFIYDINKYPTDRDTTKQKTTFASACMIPTRNNDVMKCEVARFMRCNKDEVEVNSFFVPRKCVCYHYSLLLHIPIFNIFSFPRTMCFKRIFSQHVWQRRPLRMYNHLLLVKL